MKCPHCKKETDPPDGMISNAEEYGTAEHHIGCSQCDKTIHVRATRHMAVEVRVLGKGNNDERWW